MGYSDCPVKSGRSGEDRAAINRNWPFSDPPLNAMSEKERVEHYEDMFYAAHGKTATETKSSDCLECSIRNIQSESKPSDMQKAIDGMGYETGGKDA